MKEQRSEDKKIDVKLRLIPGEDSLYATLKTASVKAKTIESLAKEVMAMNRGKSDNRRAYTQLMMAMEDRHRYAVASREDGKRAYISMSSNDYIEEYVNQAEKNANFLEIAVLSLDLEENEEQE